VDGRPGEFVQESPLGTTDASDFAITEPLGDNRGGGVAPPTPDGGPAEHAYALTFRPEIRKRQRSSQLRSVTYRDMLNRQLSQATASS
jgi:hypothetical protein